jgi:ribosomal protein S27AE
MSKIKTLFKVPNSLDSILLLLLLARLFLETGIHVVRSASDWGDVAGSQINPFASLANVLTNNDPSMWAWWFCTKWQWVFFVIVVLLILIGRKRSAGIAAISYVFAGTLIFPIFNGLEFNGSFGQNFFTIFATTYGLDGEVYGGDGKYSWGLYLLNQLDKGLGFALVLAVCVFYLIRQLPKKVKGSGNTLNMTMGDTVSEKAEFCSKCGAAASDGDFCSKCGASLITNNGGNFGYGVSSIPRTSSLAIAAIISVFFVSWVGLVLGYLARREIRESRGSLNGEGMAKAAIWIGWIFTGLAVLAAVIWGIVIGIAAGNAYSQ